MKKEKILITGGSGFVGTNIIHKLPKIFMKFSHWILKSQKLISKM